MRAAPLAALRGLALLPFCFCLNISNAAAADLNKDQGSIPVEDRGPIQVEDRGSIPLIDEVRFGLLGTDLEQGRENDGDYVINGEVLFHELGGRHYENTALEIFLHPRPHIGFNYNPDHDGVSQLYAGLTWDYNLTHRVFLEATFGGAVHDGPTGETSDSLGCTLNFHESAGIGYKLSQHWNIMAEVDHMSNAGLCDQNQGLTNAGVRLGYRW